MTLQRILTRVLVSLLLVQALVPAARAGGGDAPSSSVAAAPAESAAAPIAAGTLVWLRGPFGRVAGGTLDDPGTAPPGDQPLKTVVRHAPLVLETGAGTDVIALVVAARSLDAAGAVEPLSDGALVFEGPDGVGQHLIVADVTSMSGVASQYAWLVDVPDQQPPADGLYDIPAPDIVLIASGGSTSGRTGSGCYAYLCVDVGHPPPAETLPVLTAKVGELFTVQAADGSALTAWAGRLSSIDDPAQDDTRAKAVLAGPLENVVSLSGLEPPAAGRWLLDLEVEFDRERGWMRTFYVLDVS
ncbi:MAG TPA: hypothetical protein VFF55_11240 [Candidatus Deferrimicrobium sp.]|nr:hypothetical protein [Candidatus Deferrimicrobium sp.]